MAQPKPTIFINRTLSCKGKLWLQFTNFEENISITYCKLSWCYFVSYYKISSSLLCNIFQKIKLFLTIGGINAMLMTWNSVNHFQLASNTVKYRAFNCFKAALWFLPSNLASVYKENACMNGAKISLSNISFFAKGNAVDS